MPYAFHWLTLPDLQGSVKRGKGYSSVKRGKGYIYIYITSPQIHTRISFHGVLHFVTKIKMVNQWYQIIIATPILKFGNSDTFTSDFLTVC